MKSWSRATFCIFRRFPHEGYALENAMNYSVGFRAPNSRELISGFADYVLQRELGNTYYSDPGYAVPQASGGYPAAGDG